MTSKPDVFIIMGAAVWANGVPSNAMVRRIHAAVQAAHNSPFSIFIPSGGIGKNPPSEAEVMRRLLLNSGIPQSQIIIETFSTSTLASIINCARIIRSLGRIGRIFICSDLYHQPRCIMLFRLMTIKAEASPIKSGRSATGLIRWIYYYFRECIAIPWDSLHLFLFRYFRVNVPSAHK